MDADCSGLVVDDRQGGTPNPVWRRWVGGRHDGRGRRRTAKPGNAGALSGVKPREGKAVRPDGES